MNNATYSELKEIRENAIKMKNSCTAYYDDNFWKDAELQGSIIVNGCYLNKKKMNEYISTLNPVTIIAMVDEILKSRGIE